jgi:hypothetical protein
MIGLIQILVLIFGLFAFSRAILRWKGGSIKLMELIFWGGIWLFSMLFAIFPTILNMLSNVAGFNRGLDLVFAVSIVMLFYLLFRLYVKIDEAEQQITKLVREITLSKGKK